nr:hypothetical protein GCM10020093_077460 [Planobispora longispora]
MALTVAVLAAQSVPFLYEARRLSDEPWTVAHYLPVLASALPLLARRRYPFAALVLTLLAAGAYSLNDPDNPSQPIWYGMLVAIYTVADRSSLGRGSPRPPSSPSAPCSSWDRCPRSCAGW